MRGAALLWLAMTQDEVKSVKGEIHAILPYPRWITFAWAICIHLAHCWYMPRLSTSVESCIRTNPSSVLATREVWIDDKAEGSKTVRACILTVVPRVGPDPVRMLTLEDFVAAVSDDFPSGTDWEA